eukprot:1035418-Rhodomonas_salina.2
MLEVLHDFVASASLKRVYCDLAQSPQIQLSNLPRRRCADVLPARVPKLEGMEEHPVFIATFVPPLLQNCEQVEKGVAETVRCSWLGGCAGKGRAPGTVGQCETGTSSRRSSARPNLSVDQTVKCTGTNRLV